MAGGTNEKDSRKADTLPEAVGTDTGCVHGQAEALRRLHVNPGIVKLGQAKADGWKNTFGATLDRPGAADGAAAQGLLAIAKNWCQSFLSHIRSLPRLGGTAVR